MHPNSTPKQQSCSKKDKTSGSTTPTRDRDTSRKPSIQMKLPLQRALNWACSFLAKIAVLAVDLVRPAHSCSPFTKPALAYDADVPYTLGSIAYAEGQFATALEWFDRFIRWESITGKPHSPRAQRRLEDVQKNLPEIQFLIEYNAHADSPPPQVLAAVATRRPGIPARPISRWNPAVLYPCRRAQGQRRSGEQTL